MELLLTRRVASIQKNGRCFSEREIYNIFVVYVVLIVLSLWGSKNKNKIEKLNINIWVIMLKNLKYANHILDIPFRGEQLY